MDINIGGISKVINWVAVKSFDTKQFYKNKLYKVQCR